MTVSPTDPASAAEPLSKTAERPSSPATLSPIWLGTLAATALGFVYHLWFIYARTPEAQAAAGGLAQKIFYFHVPAAYALYLSGVVCFLASSAYLVSATHVRNAWARAGAEVAVVFGVMVLISGPLWAKKAWGVYWTWDRSRCDEPRGAFPSVLRLASHDHGE